MNYYFDDFTEEQYRQLLKIAKANWMFIDYPNYRQPGRVCLWRHDIDFSVQRAYRLAQIEANEGVKSTYFIYLHSRFYNLLESENIQLIIDIHKLGHNLGLHFDPNFYASKLTGTEQLLEFLKFEQGILTKILEVDIQVFSFHDPDIGDWLQIDEDRIADMINVYGTYFRQYYGYCSDSNGYWRFRRLHDVLEMAEDEKLQVLIHPGWWVPEPMSPRARIDRCIEGRAAKTSMQYDQILTQLGRDNVQ